MGVAEQQPRVAGAPPERGWTARVLGSGGQPPLMRRLPFFYGWVVVGMAMLSGFLGSGVNNVAMGVVFKPMSEDLGWSRTVTSGALAGATVVACLVAPLAGRLADRRGPRLLLPAGAMAVGTMALLISRVTEPWQFYLAYAPARALAVTLMIGVVPLTAVTNWFKRRRSRAMGLVTMSIPVGGAVLTLLYQALIDGYGWRSVFLLLGIAIWILVVVPGALLLRRQPEDVGLLPDGGPAPAPPSAAATGAASPTAVSSDESWTLREALRTRSLPLIVTSLGLAVLCHGSISFHLVAYYTDAGIDPAVAALALSAYAFAGGLAAGLWGFVAERVSERGLNVVTLTLSAVGMVLLLQVRTPLLAILFGALFGLSARGEGMLVNLVIASYFGRRAYGTISGVTVPFQLAGLGLGPILAAAAFDLTGSYQAIFTGYVGVYLLAALLMLLAGRPERQPVASGR